MAVCQGFSGNEAGCTHGLLQNLTGTFFVSFFQSLGNMTFNQNPDHDKPPSVLMVINNNLAGFYEKSGSMTGELV
jgi:hypothetical protein